MTFKQLGAGLALTMLLLGSAGIATADRRDNDRRPDYRRDDSRWNDDRRDDDRWNDNRRDDYRGRTPVRSRYDQERERREIVLARVSRLTGIVRGADRRDRVTAREADRLLNRLDRVRDFVRRDRNFSDEEFRRRMRELDDIQNDLRRFAEPRRYDRRW